LRANTLKQSGVLDRHRKTARQQSQDTLLLRREVIRVTALNIKHANTLAAKHQRHRELRPHIIDRVDVPRVFRRVAHTHGVPGSCRRATDPLTQRDPQIFREIARIPDRKAMLQVGSISFKHQHAKNFVIDVPLNKHSGARQHLVKIERSIYLFADFGQCCQDFSGSFRTSVFCDRPCLCFGGIHPRDYYNRRREGATS